MNRILASALSVTATAAAVLAVAAMAGGPPYADDITIDKTPFIGTRAPAEVQADETAIGVRSEFKTVTAPERY